MLRTDAVADIPREGGVVTLSKMGTKQQSAALFLPAVDVNSVPELSSLPVNCVLAQNADYMDLGVGDMDHNMHTMALVILYMMAMLNVFSWLHDTDINVHLGMLIVSLALGGVMLMITLGYYIFQRRRLSSVRFYRSSQRVVIKTSVNAAPMVIKWQDVIAYLQTATRRGFAGYKSVSLGLTALHLAWFDKENQQLHTFYTSEPNLLPMFCTNEWHVVQRYMNGTAHQFTAAYDAVPSSQKFNNKRDKVWHNFINNRHKRFFAVDFRHMSNSYLSVVIYYLFLLLGFWRIPYLVCDIYLALAVKPFFAKMSENTPHEPI